jgi:hypothetical protein
VVQLEQYIDQLQNGPTEGAAFKDWLQATLSSSWEPEWCTKDRIKVHEKLAAITAQVRTAIRRQSSSATIEAIFVREKHETD